MGHKVQPGQEIAILTIEIAVPARRHPAFVADEMSALLSEHGTENGDSAVLDWRYLDVVREVTASDDPEEGEVFDIRPAVIHTRSSYFG